MPDYGPQFQRLHFLTTIAHLGDLPLGGTEVAFAGRSNAGKSSAINTLAGQTRLAYVSKTPGRTQHLNFFAFDEQRFLVDLPGYGYAAVPDRVRSQWEDLVGSYIRYRDALAGLVLIMDARHPFRDLDADLIEWFAPSGKPIHILLTKADKLTHQESLALMRSATATAQQWPQCTLQLFSSPKRRGVDEARAKVADWLGFDAATENDGEDQKK